MCHDDLENTNKYPQINMCSLMSFTTTTWVLEQDLFNKATCIKFLGEPGDVFVGLSLKTQCRVNAEITKQYVIGQNRLNNGHTLIHLSEKKAAV